MTDGYGRKIDYMRISLTDNCNLRCSYCMPEGKISDIHYLPVETVLKCVESAVCLGITNFRLTGGEPLIYPDIEKLITKMRNVSGVNFIGITTNGVFLSEKADVLKMAGTDSINVSLDTVDSDEFRKITGRNCLKNVIDGIDAALDSRIKLKINTVLRSEVDVLKMTEFANDKNIDIRFIELMPVGIGEKNDIIPRKAVIEKLEKKYGKVCGVSKMHDENPSGTASYETINRIISENKKRHEVWMNDVDIFYNKYLKNHPLASKIDSWLFHRKYEQLVAAMESISEDKDFINKMNGISTVEVPKYQAKTLPEFDVFISHANKDKEDLIEELYQSLNTLGVNIFYDKESLEWGDNWKDRILNGTKKAEFAIIVISENFFDREWTERELAEFLNRQNRNGQKLILPILHNITTEQLKAKYPLVADIQAIDSAKYS